MRKIFIGIICIFTAFTITGCAKNSATKAKTTNESRSTVEILESDLERQMESVAEYLDNATFTVLNYADEESESATSLGSGSIYKRVINENNSYTYYLVTNRHVVSDGDKFKVYSGNGSTTATLLGTSTDYDIAVLTFVSFEKYNVVPFASIDTVKQGSYCFAMGTPLYLQYYNTFTKGNVSGIRSEVIQHTADINAGNSGGPLVNLNCELIGVNVSKLSTNQQGKPDIDGMCMAIRVDLVEKAIDEIEGKNKAILSPLLGMTVTDVSSIKAYDYNTFDDLWNELKNAYIEYYTHYGYSEAYAIAKFNDEYASKKTQYEESYEDLHAFNVYISDDIEKGMIVRNIIENSPSYNAEVKIGDVITKINNKEINNQTDFALEFYKYGVGDTFTITVDRLGETKTLTITL